MKPSRKLHLQNQKSRPENSRRIQRTSLSSDERPFCSCLCIRMAPFEIFHAKHSKFESLFTPNAYLNIERGTPLWEIRKELSKSSHIKQKANLTPKDLSSFRPFDNTVLLLPSGYRNIGVYGKF